MTEETMDEREPGEAFCAGCPDHEACATGHPCSLVKRVNQKEKVLHVRRLFQDTPICDEPEVEAFVKVDSDDGRVCQECLDVLKKWNGWYIG